MIEKWLDPSTYPVPHWVAIALLVITITALFYLPGIVRSVT